LAKFKGVKWSNLYLHIAESVWRFNHRRDEVYKILLKEFRIRPQTLTSLDPLFYFALFIFSCKIFAAGGNGAPAGQGETSSPAGCLRAATDLRPAMLFFRNTA
jgi:hypothetical protein